MPPKPPATVLQFRTATSPTPEVPIAIARRSVAHPLLAPTTPALDLSGKPRVIFLIGSGNRGKTTLARWMLERAKGQTLAAALDSVNRGLVSYFKAGVSQPTNSAGEPTNDPIISARWLRDFMGFGMTGGHTMVVDTGAGDTTLPSLLAEMPNLEEAIESAGMAAVALYMLGPRMEDLAPFYSLGFQPKATAFICNAGVADASVDGQFTPLLEQPPIRKAIENGARTIWMPRLDSVIMGQINLPHMSFERATREMGLFNASSVRCWLGSMDKAFGEIVTWLA